MKMIKAKRPVIYGVILALFTNALWINNSLPVSAKTEEKEASIMVSLGDSYSSGEGIEEFYGQEKSIEEKVKDQNWLAHRSKNAWSGMLTLPGVTGTMSDHTNSNWFFVASSGATTENLIKKQPKPYDREGLKDTKYIDPQLDVFDRVKAGSVDYVTMTFGGNDVGFKNIIETAALESSYAHDAVNKDYTNAGYIMPSKLSDMLNNTWDEFYVEGGTRDKLLNAYKSVEKKAGSQANIIVAGYPQLLDKDGSGVPFSEDEAELINSNVHRFNKAIKEIVESCANSKNKMKISFVSVEEVFDGHEAYSDDPWINEIILASSVVGSTEDLELSVLGSSAYSIHPNLKGACAYKVCVQKEIDRIEKNKKKDVKDNPVATEDDRNKKGKHFGGVVLKPEDVVLKMYDAVQDGDYKKAAGCLDPATEKQINFLGGIASTVVALFTGKYMSWGQLLLEAGGATDVEVIDCYSYNLQYESNFDLLENLLPVMPGLKYMVCTDADVYVKYRYKYDGEYHVSENTCHVKRYEWAGWRIENPN